jgi:hypothetical protein
MTNVLSGNEMGNPHGPSLKFAKPRVSCCNEGQVNDQRPIDRYERKSGRNFDSYQLRFLALLDLLPSAGRRLVRRANPTIDT